MQTHYAYEALHKHPAADCEPPQTSINAHTYTHTHTHTAYVYQANIYVNGFVYKFNNFAYCLPQAFCAPQQLHATYQQRQQQQQRLHRLPATSAIQLSRLGGH